ncbi:MAG: FAD-binding oxidoreductase [Armatimonadetes bacterium]|nr:FAD-binding oxidoreductase [Armatimonadota bacterium]MDE2205706.1 FAD-binding oxidoreductase [Armatimonadota bacterium]
MPARFATSLPDWVSRCGPVYLPASLDVVAAAVRLTEESAGAIIPVGGATEIARGSAPDSSRPLILLGSARLSGIVDYQPDDMTVTCESGVTLQRLQNLLADHNQFLPVDTPLAEHATIGGLVAANQTGLWRAAYGTPRDLVIGVRAVTAGGTLVKGGGRVVKNVAGYDVCKLFTGSWGSVGFIVEVTFKVRPRPAATCALRWRARTVGEAVLAARVAWQSKMAAAFCVATTEAGGGPCVIVGLRETEARVSWQASEFRRLLAGDLPDAAETIGEDEVDALRTQLARSYMPGEAAARITCLPSETPTVARALQEVGVTRLTVDAAVGTIECVIDAVSPANMAAAAGCTPAGGSILWRRCDTAVLKAAGLEPWALLGGHMRLHRSLKQQVDPHSTFSPGRFIGGL